MQYQGISLLVSGLLLLYIVQPAGALGWAGRLTEGFPTAAGCRLVQKKDGEGFVNPGKEELHHTRDSHILLRSPYILFFLCLPAEHGCCPRIHGMMHST